MLPAILPARFHPLTTAVCVLACAAACSKKPEVVRIARVLIDAPRQFDKSAATRESIREGVRARILAAERAELVDNTSQATHMVRLRIEPVVEIPVFDEPAAAAALEEEDGPPEMRRLRPVLVELKPTGDAPGYEAAGRGPPDVEILPASLAGFDDGWRVLERQRELDVQDDDELIAAVEDEDVRVRDFAIQRVGDRKLTEAVPLLLRRIDEETHPSLVLRTVGSLVAIGDERAVTPLIDLTYHRSPAFVLQIVFAVAGIGGRTAEGFLVTLAGGHPVLEVRKGAEQALAEMKRRGGAGR